MRSGVAGALVVLVGAAVCCAVSVQEGRQQPKWPSPAFVAAAGVGGAASANGVTPPRPSYLPLARARGARQAPPQSSAFGRAAFAFASICTAAAARAAVSRVIRHARARKFNYTDKWSQFKMQNMGYRISGAPGFPGSPHHWTEPIRWCQRFRRRITIRRKVNGTCARPRLAVFRSKHHMHVNIVDDTIGTGVTLICATTKQKPVLEEIRSATSAEQGQEKTWSEEAAEILGREVAKRCLEKNITMVVFDRGGFPYEGRVKALAEAARSGGLQF